MPEIKRTLKGNDQEVKLNRQNRQLEKWNQKLSLGAAVGVEAPRAMELALSAEPGSQKSSAVVKRILESLSQ